MSRQIKPIEIVVAVVTEKGSAHGKGTSGRVHANSLVHRGPGEEMTGYDQILRIIGRDAINQGLYSIEYRAHWPRPRRPEPHPDDGYVRQSAGLMETRTYEDLRDLIGGRISGLDSDVARRLVEEHGVRRDDIRINAEAVAALEQFLRPIGEMPLEGLTLSLVQEGWHAPRKPDPVAAREEFLLSWEDEYIRGKTVRETIRSRVTTGLRDAFVEMVIPGIITPEDVEAFLDARSNHSDDWVMVGIEAAITAHTD